MTPLSLGLVAVVVVLAAVLVTLLVKRGDVGRLPLVQQQLIEMRGRLDALAATQQEVPRTLAEGSAQQLRWLADVREELTRLSDATGRLEAVGKSVAEVQELLKVPRLRGTLGELWLEELLRSVFPAGLYETQYGFRSGERVDAVVRLGGRLVPIDSKFPLEACYRIFQAGEGDMERERREFRKSLRRRIDEIADRYIRPEEGTYDFAFMYIPAENVYYEAMVRDEHVQSGASIVGYALERKVIPVSPSTFYAYLAAVVHGLRGLEVQERAREILDGLDGMQQQFGKFERAFSLVGRHLHNAVRQYEDTSRQLVRLDGRLGSLTTVGEVGPVGDSDASPHDLLERPGADPAK